MLRLTYHIPSVSDLGGRFLEVVVEANATERTSYLPVAQLPFSYRFRGQYIETIVNGFEIHEMLGTKMRAMFQRKRGRDLFDLYWALTESQITISPSGVISAFQYYMEQEGSVANRAEFIRILDMHLRDRGFLTDMDALLRKDILYIPLEAGTYIIDNLLNLLPPGKQ